MSPGALRVESANSVWFIDGSDGRYLRMPKDETPRQDGTAERGTKLEDLVWHPFGSVEVRGADSGSPRLWFDFPCGVNAPLGADEARRLAALLAGAPA